MKLTPYAGSMPPKSIRIVKSRQLSGAESSIGQWEVAIWVSSSRDRLVFRQHQPWRIAELRAIRRNQLFNSLYDLILEI